MKQRRTCFILTYADTPVKFAQSQSESSLTADKRMDCEESSRIVFDLPGSEGAEVIRLESESIRSIEKYEVRRIC